MMQRIQRSWGLSLALIVAATTACKPKVSEPRSFTITLVVRAAKDSNGGRPLHLVVRATTRKDFVEDDYSAVASLVVATDEAVIERMVVFPGQVYVMKIKVPKLPETVGVYGLFTRAKGEAWKLMFEQASTIELAVGAETLERAGSSAPIPGR
jgi:predicted component of type VI protein secretion system